MENNNKSGSHDISKIRNEVANYLNMNYGSVKGKKILKVLKEVVFLIQPNLNLWKKY